MGSKHIDTYIHRLAKTMAGQLNIDFKWFDRCEVRRLGAEVLCYHERQITEKIKAMSLQTQAKIAAQGTNSKQLGRNLSLEDVHLTSGWVNGSLSGEVIITRVAMTAVVAAMVDLMKIDRQWRVSQQPAQSRSETPCTLSLGTDSLGRTVPSLPTLDRYDGTYQG